MASKAKSPSLDLHGLRAEEVFDAVDRFLRNPKVQNCKSARIMPGKGKGIVRQKLIEYLRLGGYPWSYEKDTKGNTNEGVIVVHME